MTLIQGHGHGVYPLIYLPGGLEPESDEESDEVAKDENGEGKAMYTRLAEMAYPYAMTL